MSHKLPRSAEFCYVGSEMFITFDESRSGFALAIVCAGGAFGLGTAIFDEVTTGKIPSAFPLTVHGTR